VAEIHPTAIIDRKAEIASDVEIGPYCIVGPNVKLEAGCRLVAHVVLDGHTTVGEGTRIHPFACIGQPPQHLRYKGEPSTITIGPRSWIREHVTIHPGTEGGRMATTVGAECLLMASIHIAHDCIVGNGVVMANNATLGGHVTVGDYAFLGGLCAVHQFVRIGQYAMLGGLSGVENDVIPYGLVIGNRAHLSGLNNVGMKRRGVSRDEIRQMRNAYRTLFEGEGAFADRLNEVAEVFADQPRVMELVDFISKTSSRDLCHPRAGDRLL
jgi:UDP-N-acetylglucosamine acyltransferase